MNALPLKPGKTPADVIEDLIANHGLRAVLIAVARKLLKRTRPPDTIADLVLQGQLHVDGLDDRLRADIGLGPNPKRDTTILLAHVRQRDLFHF